MNKLLLKIYLNRIIYDLQNVYNYINESIDDDELREKIIKKVLKPEIQTEYNEWVKNNFFMAMPKKFKDEKNMDELVQYGDLVALKPLNNFLKRLKNDLELLEEEE